MNAIIIMGHVAIDPKTQLTKNGSKMTKLIIADNISKDNVIWWQCYVFGSSCEKILPYIKKGSAVIIFGEVKKLKIFKRNDGSNDVSTEIIISNIKFSPFKSGKQLSGEQQNKKQETQASQQPQLSF